MSSAATAAVSPVAPGVIRPEHLRYLRDPDFVAFANRTIRSKTKPQIRWDDVRIQFLIDHYPFMILPRLTRAFNDAFGLTVTEKAIGFQLSWRSIRKAVRPTVGPAVKRRRPATGAAPKSKRRRR